MIYGEKIPVKIAPGTYIFVHVLDFLMFSLYPEGSHTN